MLKTIQGWWRREEGTKQLPELTLAITKLMVGMMAMDGNIDAEERNAIVKLLGEHFSLSDDKSAELIDQATDEKRTDLSFNKIVEQIKAHYNVDERATILAKLWRVAMADGDINFLEEQYINRLSGLIGVPSELLSELKEKQETLYPDLEQSDRFQHPNPIIR
ncbi:MAG: TerB family tellurite resistance protein [Mariprofundus sp.]